MKEPSLFNIYKFNRLLIPFLKGTISPENGITALHLCCWIGNIKLVKLLLKSGVHVDLSDSQGFTPLHIACHRGFDPIVKLLLSCGACPSAVSANLDTPLHLSCYEHHHIVCALLLSLNGFFFETKSPTAVCEISQRKSTESIIINRRSDSHVNALPEAKSHPVSVLLDDFNSNQKDQKNILSPEDDTNKFLATLVKRSGSFSTGSARRKSQNEEAFIDFPLWEIKKAPQGAPSPVDVNAQDKELNTPLHFCSRKGFKTIAAWLLAAGADPSVVNVYGDTPLHSACYGRQFELVYMLLLSSSGEINMSRFNIFSESPLHAACTSGASDRIVRLLISRPSLNVNIQGPDGHTALHSACWNGHVNTTLLLLEHGADISKTTFDGSSPMKWAYTKGHDDIVELLQTYSGDRELFPIPSPLGKVRAITQVTHNDHRYKVCLYTFAYSG
jgi:ankyrin repeat protein